MCVYKGKLWDQMKRAAEKEDMSQPENRKTAGKFAEAMVSLCEYGVARSKTIRDTFPLYTLHDDVHIRNVLGLMGDLLGGHLQNLTRDEAAMLLLSACFHDIGMSYTEAERAAALQDSYRIQRYLDRNQGEFVKAYASGTAAPVLTEDMQQNFLRSIHHERVETLLNDLDWPEVFCGCLDREDLIAVCQSHGESVLRTNTFRDTDTVDLRLCGILLRLADILDFDASRAPWAIYKYNCFESREDDASRFSASKWEAHLLSKGFDFRADLDRSYPYELKYIAQSTSIQTEQDLRNYLTWVDREFSDCLQQLRHCENRHRTLVLPRKVRPDITAKGYESGAYRLSLDQGQVMELLVGKNLYHDPAVFVRELLQNAIDAVRTRKALDKSLPGDWTGQINIRSWMDQEGYHWFRIEDNGTGMTKEIIENYFLKIGQSYYTSDDFAAAKLRSSIDSDFMPISRFGIGILSCFMGDEKTNLVEVSTKRFRDSDGEHPALRLRMNGLNGYYYMANSKKGHKPEPMRGKTKAETEPYRKEPGTVIAVRANLYQSGTYRGFREIVDKYVLYPQVPIHYDGEDGSFDYPTEAEFQEAIRSIRPSDNPEEQGLLEFPLSDAAIRRVQADVPELVFTERPGVRIKCAPLSAYSQSPYLAGAVVKASPVGKAPEIQLTIGHKKERAGIRISVVYSETDCSIGLKIELKFEYDFENQMQLAETIPKDSISRMKRKLLRRYSGDPVQSEIARSLIDAVTDSPRWKQIMMDTHGLSEEELESRVREIQETYNQLWAKDYGTDDLSNRLRAYNRMTKEWEFFICDLSRYDWYRKYFLPIWRRVGMQQVAAHNGIYCGDSRFFFRTWPKQMAEGAILLLKDQYRPVVDVSRDAIRRLSLETAADLDILREQLMNQGFDFSGNQQMAGELLHLTTKECWALLDRHPDFVDRLRFDTDAGLLTAAEMDTALRQGRKLSFYNRPKFDTFRSTLTNGYLHDILCAAYLKENYTLSIENFRSHMDIFVENRREHREDPADSFFPPTFFLTPETQTHRLTNSYLDYRIGFNRSHPLSRFLIDNAPQLQQKVPGIFQELLRSLAEDPPDKMVPVINDLLNRLKQVPNLDIAVPRSLWLGSWDFESR